jgi:hypothetical protein
MHRFAPFALVCAAACSSTPAGDAGGGGSETSGHASSSTSSSTGAGTSSPAGSRGSGSGGTASSSQTTGGQGDAGSSTPPGDGGAAPPGASTEDVSADCTVTNLPTTTTSNAKLPDPFTKLDGTRIATKADWHCRREEIRALAQKFAYGTKPPKPQTVTGTVSKTSVSVMVNDSGKTASFSASVTLPTSGTAPYPVIVTYGGAAPLDTTVINSEGVAIINYDPMSTGMEGTGRTNKQGAFYTIVGSSSTTGLLVAWGWGVSRIIDVIAASDGTILRADAVAVSGCSRFGKGAFIAGAMDDRIALTMPIESGTAGVPIWRMVNSEGAQTLASAFGEQPWFGDAFNPFTGDPTKAPIDTHETIALIAPRGLFIMDNPFIANLGPKSADVAALAGAEVYKALGAGSNITYWSAIANGNHCSMRPEWSQPLKDNIEKFLKKTGNAAGVIKPAASATGTESQWVDWSTPTLN